MQKVIGTIRRMAGSPEPSAPTDDLLTRFFVGKDESAFEDLVRRYGPMVYGVCLRVLGHHQDAEDAFQATFLMLVRKGKTIRRHKCVSAWLYRVAYRLALTQRARTKNRAPEQLMEVAGAIEPVDPAWLELRSALDEEVQRLPGHYRSVLVLCALEGKSYDAAADQLGCPRGTVAVRLLRAREMLKKRLVRRGLIGAATSLTAQVTLPQAMANVPAALAAATSSAAVANAFSAATTAIPAGASSLLSVMARQYWRERCQIALILLAAVAITGATVSGGAQARMREDHLQQYSSGQVPNRSVAKAPASSVAPAAQQKPLANQGGQLNGQGTSWNLNLTTK